MADDIRELAERLQQHSIFLFNKQPKYIIDYSWPSVGLLQLYLAPILHKEHFAPHDETLIDLVASHLGCMAVDYWRVLTEGKAMVTLEGPPIRLHAKGGPLLPKRESFSVDISQTLRDIISTPSNPFPFLGDWTLPKTGLNIMNEPETHSQRNLVSSFALGLFTGLCPYGNGPWKEKTLDEWTKNLTPTHYYLCKGATEHYARCYPLEPLGTKLETFAAGLILPPYGTPEIPDYYINLQILCEHLKEHPREEILGLAKNLSHSPEPTMAHIGFILALALEDSGAQITASADILRPYLHRILPSLSLAQKSLSHGLSWPELLSRGLVDQARKDFEREIDLGLIPELFLSTERLNSKSYHPLLESLRSRHLTNCLVQTESIFLSGNRDSDITHQYVLMQIFFGQYPLALKTLQEHFEIRDQFYSPSDRLRLLALFAKLGAPEDFTVPWFDKTLQELKPPLRSPILLNDAVEQLLRLGIKKYAVHLTNMILKQEPYALRVRMLRYHMLKGSDAADKDYEFLLRQAPMQPETFVELHKQQLLKSV